jgi:hypothetical protein
MSDQVINTSRREFLGASALLLSSAVLGVRAMTNTTAAAATPTQNPFTLVYRGAIAKNEPGKVNTSTSHRSTTRKDGRANHWLVLVVEKA